MSTSTGNELGLKNHVKRTSDNKVFQVLEGKGNKVMLRHKTDSFLMEEKEFKQALLVRKTYDFINIHELKKYLKELDEFSFKLTKKMMKGVFLSQLLLENNDELLKFHKGDNNLRNLINRSNKALERKSDKFYDKLYEANKVLMSNISQSMDEVFEDMVSIEPHLYIHLAKYIKDMKENPKKFEDMPYELKKLDE